MLDETIEEIVASYAIEKTPASEWDWQGISDIVFKCFNLQLDLPQDSMGRLNPTNFRDTLKEQAHTIFDGRVKEMGDELMDHLIKVMMLQAIDTHWKDHLLNIDHLKEGIGLRGYGQKDPKQEYKKEAFNLFMEMIIRIREEVVERIYWVQVERPEEVEKIEEEQQQRSKKLVFNLSGDEDRPHEPAKSQKVAGRNDACPCGSGKKYKKCCGA
jgi:preprotein translocase subunit SecA